MLEKEDCCGVIRSDILMIATIHSIEASDLSVPVVAPGSSFGSAHQSNQALAAPSFTHRALVAILGLSMVAAGPCLVLLNFDNEGWAWALSIITTWLGLSLLLLLWMAGSRHSAAFEQRLDERAALLSQGNVVHLNPLMKTLSELGQQTNSQSVILLSAEGAEWRLRIAWNCSQVYGNNIAHLLEGRVQSGTQSVQCLSLMDGAVSSFCTPIHLRSGGALLLVLINEVNHTMLFNTPSLAFEASMKIVDQLGSVRHSMAARAHPGMSATPRKAVCCAVCDSLQTQDGRWISWGDWLFENHQTTRTNTFCESCAQWVYHLDPSELRAA